MKPVTSMSKYYLHRAIVQVVGELENLGQQVRITDVAQFLGCSKPTAQYNLKRMQMFKLIKLEERPYRSNAKVYIVHLGTEGQRVFNNQVCVDSKLRVLEMRGVLA